MVEPDPDTHAPGLCRAGTRLQTMGGGCGGATGSPGMSEAGVEQLVGSRSEVSKWWTANEGTVGAAGVHTAIRAHSRDAPELDRSSSCVGVCIGMLHDAASWVVICMQMTAANTGES